MSRARRGGGHRNKQSIFHRGLKQIFGAGRRVDFYDDDEEADYLDNSSPRQSVGCWSLPGGRQRGGGGPPSRGGSSVSRFLDRLGLPTQQNRQKRGHWRNTPLQQRLGMQRQGTSARPTEDRWFKVVIPKGRLMGKEFIMKSLNAYLDEEEASLVPLLFTFTPQGEAVFSVNSQQVAEALRMANNRISHPKLSQPMRIFVGKSADRAPYPYALSGEQVEVVKQMLMKRYNADLGHLDLSKFALDSVVVERQMESQLMLLKPAVMMCLLALCQLQAGDHVKSLNMAENRLRSLDYLANFVAVFKNLQRLSLANNQIENVEELEKLNGWKLVELELDGNTVCGEFSTQAAYVSAVHTYFPKVNVLDGTRIEAELQFGLDEADTSAEKTLPVFKPGFVLNDEVGQLVSKFVMEYISIFDKDEPNKNRSALLQAYHSDATFTMTVQSLSKHAFFSNRDEYMSLRRESHNIVFEEMWSRHREKIVHKGALNVLSQLSKLPKTEHILDSFLLDVSFAEANLLSFTLQGLLREGERCGTDSAELRFFTRTFIVVPTGPGQMAVVNEQLLISPMTDQQIRRYRQQISRTNDVIPGPPTVMAPESGQEQNRPISSEEEKGRLVRNFSSETRMKEEWSRKCLEEHDWQLPAAVTAFQQLKDRIPPEAFI